MNKLHKKLLIIAPLLMVSILVASVLPDIMTFAQPSADQKHAISETKPSVTTDRILTQSVEGVIETEVNHSVAEKEKMFVSNADAKKIALEKVTGEIVEFEMDGGKYQVEIHADGKEYEMSIDTHTGKITEFEVDESNKTTMASTKTTATTSKTTTINNKMTTATKTRISSEQAKKIALTKVNGLIVDFELDDDEYEVEIHADGNEYEMTVDAYTGKITEFEVEEGHKTTMASTKTTVATNATATTSKSLASVKKARTANRTQITSEQAKKIALGKVYGTIVDFELDDDEYEVEIHANGKEYEMTIDAYTGKITEFEVDDQDNKSVLTTQKKTRITREQAKKIALGKVYGTIVDFELDDDEYEVEIHANGKEYEMSIDAYTGKITEFEVDDFDD